MCTHERTHDQDEREIRGAWELNRVRSNAGKKEKKKDKRRLIIFYYYICAVFLFEEEYEDLRFPRRFNRERKKERNLTANIIKNKANGNPLVAYFIDTQLTIDTVTPSILLL